MIYPQETNGQGLSAYFRWVGDALVLVVPHGGEPDQTMLDALYARALSEPAGLADEFRQSAEQPGAE